MRSPYILLTINANHSDAGNRKLAETCCIVNILLTWSICLIVCVSPDIFKKPSDTFNVPDGLLDSDKLRYARHIPFYQEKCSLLDFGANPPHFAVYLMIRNDIGMR